MEDSFLDSGGCCRVARPIATAATITYWLAISAGSSIAAMIFNSAPQFGHRSRSMS
jgi:hypothetical protein